MIAAIMVSILAVGQTASVSEQGQKGTDSIQNVIVKPDFNKGLLELGLDSVSLAKGDRFLVEVSFEGRQVAFGEFGSGQPMTVDMPSDFHRWTPDHPCLYDLKIIVLRDDEVVGEHERSFAMRCFGNWREENSLNRFALNGLPIFLFGTLWTAPIGDSLHNEAIASDLQRIKDLGFNMVRVRDEIDLSVWLPLCDRMGLVLWHEGFDEVASRLQNVPTVEIQLPMDNLAFEEATDNYVGYANRLYQETYQGFSAAVIGQLADTGTNANGLLSFDRSKSKVDEKRLFFINRKISHALAE